MGLVRLLDISPPPHTPEKVTTTIYFKEWKIKIHLRVMVEACRSSPWKAEAGENMSLSEASLAVEQLTDKQARES